jgi:hypothetical protein
MSAGFSIGYLVGQFLISGLLIGLGIRSKDEKGKISQKGKILIAIGVVIAIFVMTGNFLKTLRTSGALTANTHTYPANVKENFMKSCGVTEMKPICECSFKKIQVRYTLKEFTKIDEEMQSSSAKPSDELMKIVQGCVTESK